MKVQVTRIGAHDEEELAQINALSPLERKLALLEAAQVKAMALAINPSYSKPGLRDDRYYATDGRTVYWFGSDRRRDDWVKHFPGGESIARPTLAQIWSAQQWRDGDRWYYARNDEGLRRFPRIEVRDNWIIENNGRVVL